MTDLRYKGRARRRDAAATRLRKNDPIAFKDLETRRELQRQREATRVEARRRLEALLKPE